VWECSAVERECVGIRRGDAGVGERRKVGRKLWGASERVLIKECMPVRAVPSAHFVGVRVVAVGWGS
jgi:hypothetical protein